MKGSTVGSGIGAVGGSFLGPAGTALGGALGGILGGLFDSPDNSAAEAQQKAIDAINALDVDDLSKKVLLQQYQQNGTLSPELLEQLQLNADQKTTMTENPENRANQQYALNALKELSQTGMSAADRAQAAEMRSNVAQDTGAKTQQLLQQSQMRGQLGGGDALAAQLMANQQGGQEASKAALNQAAQAAQARQQALASYGQQAGQVRGQDYNTLAANTENDIARQKFLDANSVARQNANIAAKNQANEINLTRQQGVGDKNAGAANTEAQRSSNLRADLSARKALGLADVYSGAANRAQTAATGEAASTGLLNQGIIGGIKDFSAGGGFGGLGKKDEESVSGGGGVKRAMAQGGRVEGQPPFKGDSPHNDVVEAMLSPSEIVVPVSKAKDPKKAKTFIDDLFANEKPGQKDNTGYDRNEALLDLIAKLHSKK